MNGVELYRGNLPQGCANQIFDYCQRIPLQTEQIALMPLEPGPSPSHAVLSSTASQSDTSQSSLLTNNVTARLLLAVSCISVETH